MTLAKAQVAPPSLDTWILLSPSSVALVPLTSRTVSLVMKSVMIAPVSSVMAVMATVSLARGAVVSMVTSWLTD